MDNCQLMKMTKIRGGCKLTFSFFLSRLYGTPAPSAECQHPEVWSATIESSFYGQMSSSRTDNYLLKKNTIFTPIMTPPQTLHIQNCLHINYLLIPSIKTNTMQKSINLVCYKSILEYCTEIYHSQYTIHTIFKSNKVSFGKQN